MQKDKRLPESTRQRILGVAQEMGYQPDPMLGCLNAYRRSLSTPAYQGLIGWVSNFQGKEDWRERPQYVDYFSGAERRAGEFGYRLEHFWLGEKGMSGPRMKRIWQTRNVRGLLFCPQPMSGTVLDDFHPEAACMTFGYSLSKPAYHLVSSHQFQSAVTVCRELRALGYRRIGWAVEPDSDERVERKWSGGFFTESVRWPQAERVSPVPAEDGKITRGVFLQWLQQERPDVIVADRPRALCWLKEAGLRVPDDIGHALLSKPQAEDEHAGIDEGCRQQGMAAVELLVGMIQQGARGLPGTRRSLLLAGSWSMGCTVRRISCTL